LLVAWDFQCLLLKYCASDWCEIFCFYCRSTMGTPDSYEPVSVVLELHLSTGNALRLTGHTFCPTNLGTIRSSVWWNNFLGQTCYITNNKLLSWVYQIHFSTLGSSARAMLLIVCIFRVAQPEPPAFIIYYWRVAHRQNYCMYRSLLRRISVTRTVSYFPSRCQLRQVPSCLHSYQLTIPLLYLGDLWVFIGLC
jgi:hypothetical protein